MDDADAALDAVLDLDGAIAVAVTDCSSGFVLAQRARVPFDMDLAAAAMTEVVRAKQRAVDLLGLEETVEDVLVTLTHQLHVVRVSAREDMEGVFHYLVLDRSGASLALARRALMTLDREFTWRWAALTAGALS